MEVLAVMQMSDGSEQYLDGSAVEDKQQKIAEKDEANMVADVVDYKRSRPCSNGNV